MAQLWLYLYHGQLHVLGFSALIREDKDGIPFLVNVRVGSLRVSWLDMVYGHQHHHYRSSRDCTIANLDCTPPSTRLTTASTT